jgi:protein-S-isoprenylcysteine O-methyltransferase Ste14
VIVVPLMLLAIFLPAGSLDYWQGWLFFTVILICGALSSLYFSRRDPRLFARRMKFKEQRPAQKIIVPLLYGLNAATIVAAATDHRLGWSVDLPLLGVAGDLMVVAGFYLYFLVFRENSFAGSTIEISADQRVISTGPYAIVRHPLYVALTVTTLGMPARAGLLLGGAARGADGRAARLAFARRGSLSRRRSSGILRVRKEGPLASDTGTLLARRDRRRRARAAASYSGMLPCLRCGVSLRLSRSISSAVAMALRVLRASMTSST